MAQEEGKKRRRRKRSKGKLEGDAHDESTAEKSNQAEIEEQNDGETLHDEGAKFQVEIQQQQDKLVGDEEAKPKRKRKRKRKSKATADDSAGSATAASQENEKLSSLDHTAYVEGIPFDCTEEDVKEFFVSNQCDDILQMRLPRWQDSGRLRGYGHVVFQSQESRNKAITLSGKTLGKRYLTIQAPKAPRADTSMGAMKNRTVRDQPEGCKTVFVKNLPYDATEEDVQEAFQVCGKIVAVRIARNSVTQQSKGFAYVEYKNPEGASSAVGKAAKPFGMTVKGRPAFVDYEEGTQKASFKRLRK